MTHTITDTDEAWDLRRLGADAAHVQVAGPEHEAALLAALKLKQLTLIRRLIDEHHSTLIALKDR